VIPQPVSLPSVDVTETVAEPWETDRPAQYALYPFPPVDYVFEKEFRVTFQESDFPAEGYYEMPLEITSTSGGFDDVFAINTLQVRFEARTPTLTPFFAIVRAVLAASDAITVSFPGESLITLARNTSDYQFEINVYIWSADTADKNAAANIVKNKLMSDYPGLPSSDFVINDLTSLTSSSPDYGVGYVVEIVDTDELDGMSGQVFAGFAEASSNLAQLAFGDGITAEWSWTGTISWNEP